MKYFPINSWSGTFDRSIRTNCNPLLNNASIFNLASGYFCAMPQMNIWGCDAGFMNPIMDISRRLGTLAGGLIGRLFQGRTCHYQTTSSSPPKARAKTEPQQKNKDKDKIKQDDNTSIINRPVNDCPNENVKNEINRITNIALNKYLEKGTLSIQDIPVERVDAKITSVDTSGVFKKGDGEKNDYEDEQGNTVRVADGIVITVKYTYQDKEYSCRIVTDKVPKQGNIPKKIYPKQAGSAQ